MKVTSVKQLFVEKPYLAWYIKDVKNLSDESLLEHILNYGQWEDYLVAENEMGITKTKALFLNLATQKRVNLRPQTINYFHNYFNKYAP